MRLDNQTDAIETNIEEGSAKTFTMVANGASFRVLSDALYSDKPGAIIRELTCNAWDAHVAAGHMDKQVEIHLPDALMPEFWVRDFGTGLSDEDVLGLYTTYFQSTKSQSNLFTGALGLGSKSPFCYTDNFVVESYFEGTLRRYQVYLSEDIPSILPIGEEKTDQPNGLRISFSVPEKDHRIFRDAAERQLFLFEGKTTYTSNFNSMARFRGQGIFLENSDFIISKEMPSSYSRTVSNTELFAAMGNVLYRIDPSLVMDPTSKIAGIKAILKFDMGTIDFAASRENLSYKPRTVTAIQAKLEKIVQAISDHFDVLRATIENKPIMAQIFECQRLSKESQNSNSNNVIAFYGSIKGEFFWNTILKRISNKLTNEFHLSCINYVQRWSRRSNKWYADNLGVNGFLDNLKTTDFRCVKGTARITAENFTKVARKSGLPTSGGIYCYASEDNWDNIEKYLNEEFGYVELDFDIPKEIRYASDATEKFQNRKVYDHWIKGSKDSTRMFKENFDTIFFNNEDNCNREWMKVFSALLDSPKTPFVYYRGPIRSALECSFVNYTWGHYGSQTIEPSMAAIKEKLKENVKKMRLYDALYCRRFLHEEIRIIQDALPFSEFVQEIANIEIYPLIENADTMRAYIGNAELLDSCPSYENSVPDFLDRYPMLRLIRADLRHHNHYSAKETDKKDAKQLIDYIRLCEGEGYEVHHYDIISDSKRRKRKLKSLQDRTRREESAKADREEGHEGVERDSEEALNNVHREGIQEEEYRDQGREVLLQDEGDSQQPNNNDDSVVSVEETNGSVHSVLRTSDAKSFRKFTQRTLRLSGSHKTPDYKSRYISRVSKHS